MPDSPDPTPLPETSFALLRAEVAGLAKEVSALGDTVKARDAVIAGLNAQIAKRDLVFRALCSVINAGGFFGG